MIILPDRSLARPKILRPHSGAAFRWNAGFRSQRTSIFGEQDRTYHYVTARLHDGHKVWRGRFDDQEDFDAFAAALADGSTWFERALWDLPTPAWRPDLGEWLRYDFLSQTNLTSPTGSQQTYTSDPTWFNGFNVVYVIAGGGAGGEHATGGGAAGGGGGGGGGCSTGINFSFAVPGTTTAGYQLAASQPTNAANGNNSWFNGTAINTSGAVSAIGGGGGPNNSATGGSGSTTGAQAQGGGVTNAGGNGGGGGASAGSGGGGGAGGPNGAGVAGTPGSLTNGGGGGGGDAGNDPGGTGGTAGSGVTPPGVGNPGTEIGGVGFGGGGGGSSSVVAQGGNGGNYGGGGGGGGVNGAGGTGAQGATFLIWPPLQSLVITVGATVKVTF